MSVTITRKTARRLGEEAVAEAVQNLHRDGYRADDETPQIIAFRQVIELGSTFLTGSFARPVDGEYAKCPMAQTVFDAYTDRHAISLAFAWDSACTRNFGKQNAAYLVRVNPHNETGHGS